MRSQLAKLQISSPIYSTFVHTAGESPRRHSPQSSISETPTSVSSVTTASTAPTSVAESEHSCQFDTEDWFARFRDEVDVSDDFPSEYSLEEAGNVPIFDATGNSRLFKTLYQGDQVIHERQLVLFVRHFYCGACQAFLRAFNEKITPSYYNIPVPTQIIVIGCGSPEMIKFYKETTGTPFPVFADPSRRLYKALGMSLTLNIGKRPEYMKGINELQWVAGQARDVKKNKGLRLKGGNLLQIGGEFLFRDGGVEWCHRMKNYRNHTEMDVLRRILELDD